MGLVVGLVASPRIWSAGSDNVDRAMRSWPIAALRPESASAQVRLQTAHPVTDYRANREGPRQNHNRHVHAHPLALPQPPSRFFDSPDKTCCAEAADKLVKFAILWLSSFIQEAALRCTARHVQLFARPHFRGIFSAVRR